MSWRVAESLLKLRDQINQRFPNRIKVNDGTIGDAAHATRNSDHNPWVKDGKTGVVTALDITHDLEYGVDCGVIAEGLRQSGDPRIKYLIWNKRIWNPSVSSEWRPYTGTNPHNKHFHISVKETKPLYDDRKEWKLVTKEERLEAPIDRQETRKQRPLLKKGSKGQDVKDLQSFLKITADGIFGPNTEKAVKELQTKHKLVADGIVGAYTWSIIDA
jgi:hypothetical protein